MLLEHNIPVYRHLEHTLTSSNRAIRNEMTCAAKARSLGMKKEK